MSADKMNVSMPNDIIQEIGENIVKAESVAFVVFGGSEKTNNVIAERLIVPDSPLYGMQIYRLGSPMDRFLLRCSLSRSMLGERGSMLFQLSGKAITNPDARHLMVETLRKQGAEKVVGVYVDFDKKAGSRLRVNSCGEQFAAAMRDNPPLKDAEEWDSLYTIHLGDQS